MKDTIDICPPKVAEITQKINFGCNWIKDECEGMRQRAKRLKVDKVGYVCCRACAHNKGYLRIKEIPKEYLAYWDERKGFFEPTFGCKLPWNMRSLRCNVYVCRDATPAQEDRIKLLELESGNY